MPRAKQRTPELRDRVLDVAITTLGEEGIARFTTRRVAERAARRCPRCTSCSTTRPAWCGRCSSRASGCWAASWPRSRRRTIALADLERLVPVFRLFCRAYPKLAQVMFSRPFADFEPGPDELAAGAASARSSSAGSSGVSTRVCSAGTRRTSRTYCSRWHRVWRCRRQVDGWVRRRRRSSDDGRSACRRCSTGSAGPRQPLAGSTLRRCRRDPDAPAPARVTPHAARLRATVSLRALSSYVPSDNVAHEAGSYRSNR